MKVKCVDCGGSGITWVTVKGMDGCEKDPCVYCQGKGYVEVVEKFEEQTDGEEWL